MCVSDYIESCFLQPDGRTSYNLLNGEGLFSEDEVLEQFIVFIKKKMKFSIVDWEPTKKEYPSHMFLSGDKGILAYIDFKYVESKDSFSVSELACDSKLLLKTLRCADSKLDRPVFFVYLLNYRDKKGIYFETNEQIKDRWLKSPYSSDCYVPVFNEMGDIDNLIAIWADMKKNNVNV